MRQELANVGKNVPGGATYQEVLGIYLDYEDSGALLDLSKVKYPLEPTAALHPSKNLIKEMKRVKMKDVSQIIRDLKIPAVHVAGLVTILAKLVELDKFDKDKVKATFQNVLP